MTDEQINIAIAEIRKWESETSGPLWYEYQSPNPNYAGCLNAMHEAEKVLNENDQYLYWHFLYKMCGGSQEFDLLHATARQRAEAFLRTLGKWEDEA